MTDKNNREIRAGDLLRVYHFRAARRRKVYMYKVVCRVTDGLEVHPTGDYLYAVDVTDIVAKNDLQKAHKCPISVLEPSTVEIISGRDYWWERPRND